MAADLVPDVPEELGDDDSDEVPDVQHWVPCCDSPGWYENGIKNPDAFYAERSEGGQTSVAKAMCRRCPRSSRARCLLQALALSNDMGVWAGLSPKQRRVARRMIDAGWPPTRVITFFDMPQPVLNLLQKTWDPD